MVFIRKIEKVESFLKNFHEKFPITEEEKTESENNKFIELPKLEKKITVWNNKNPEKNVFLHELISFSDITYTLEYRDYERDKEFNVNFFFLEGLILISLIFFLKKTPEWKATKEKIKARQEEREYQKMLSNNVSAKSEFFFF